MARSIPALVEAINEATAVDFRGALLTRGRARSLIVRDGELPADAPGFDPQLRYDLLAYGFGLLDHGLRLHALSGGEAEFEDHVIAACKAAGDALSSVVVNGAPLPDRDFHRLVAGCAYHFAKLAARAFSLVHEEVERANLSESERCIAFLITRDFSAARSVVENTLLSGDLGLRRDAALNPDAEDGVDQAGSIDAVLTDQFLRALAIGLQAFERGSQTFIDAALERLRTGLETAAEFALVDQWWSHRLAIRLLQDLWGDSFHVRLPRDPGPLPAAAWRKNREIFIAALLSRPRAEVGLWPSQIEVAKRAFDLASNMVVALPTSAGKTRVAELCILACITAGKRVFFVTPLRSLSAQTETTLRRTFSPLGIKVSSLYGSIGDVGDDHELIETEQIVVTTPEKLDFALRNDPSLLDDVGLVVLDEGHMIGVTQREIRYEVQIQRLLRREDAASRRIVCLSAVLPSGSALEDFTGWLTNDDPDGLVEKDWRPTQLRFGEVLRRADGSARMEIALEGQNTFVNGFITPSVPPKGRRKKAFPADQRELCLATAWQFLEEGKSVLIFCPQRRSVEPFAKAIVDLHEREALTSVFRGDPQVLAAAIAIGREWFGDESPVVECLRLGVAIHHGSLPTPFRREVDRLIASGHLRLVIASPTLAQGLNLSAAVLIFHGTRMGKRSLNSSEFHNVVGRAGRAYVDSEGLVLLPIFDLNQKQTKARQEWAELIADRSGKEMRSGLLRLVIFLVARIAARSGRPLEDALEYIGNMANWTFVPAPSDRPADLPNLAATWSEYLQSLDTAILSLVGDVENEAETDIAELLDDVLESSLWSRAIERTKPEARAALTTALEARTAYIFAHTTPTQRKFYFLANVGLDSGHVLDAKWEELRRTFLAAEAALLALSEDTAVEAIIAFATIAFTVPAFTPSNLREDWPELLSLWVRGKPLPIAEGEELPRFVENAFVYSLVWALESVRLRGAMADAADADGMTFEDFDLGRTAQAVETGMIDASTSLLLRQGLGSRAAAGYASRVGNASFDDRTGMRAWLRSEPARKLNDRNAWDDTDGHTVWSAFRRTRRQQRFQKWKQQTVTKEVTWSSSPEDNVGLTLIPSALSTTVLSADLKPIGIGDFELAQPSIGVTTVRSVAGDLVEIRHVGPASPVKE